MTYPTKKLGEICDVVIGGTPRRGISKYWNDGTLPWVSIADLSRNGREISETKEKITEIGAKESNVKLLKRDTLLFSFKLSIGKVAFAGADLYTNEAIAGLCIKSEKELDKEYLFYFLQQFDFSGAQKAVKGATLNKSKINNLKIPMPPVGEQRKIVARIKKQFAKIDEAAHLRSESEALSDQFLPAALAEIFSSPESKGWQEVAIGDKKVMQMTSGRTPSRSNSKFYGGKIAWLKSGELNDNTQIENSEEHITNEALQKSNAKVFPSGTVLLAMYGATAGKLGILAKSAATNQAVAGLTPNPKYLDSKFLYYCLSYIREQIVDQAWGGAQPNLSQTILKTFKIPLPPLAEQKKIVEKIAALAEKARTLRDLQSSQSADLKSLKQSMLRQAFAQ